ncbi:MAG: aminoglycoside phosphotransferase [Desulfocapsa sp.]|nr:MAG: aminoglycoside phosphotransferase [Desulfocapsa sp.]
MNAENETNNLSIIHDLLQSAGLVGSDISSLQIEEIKGDGSSRKFWRISEKNKKVCLAVAPPNREAVSLAEARSARAIGMHLLQKQIPVPAQYGWDEDSGILLFEDFGDCKLHDYVLEHKKQENGQGEIRLKYQQLLKGLVEMQIRGAESFDSTWCWDTPQYDKKLIQERESGYFLKAFWLDLMGKEGTVALQEELEDLAVQAASIPATFFLHRDFQSRNIMLYDGKTGFIDFQGGRLGPLAYDLASILRDPYTELSRDLQEDLWDFYLTVLEQYRPVHRQQFRTEYLLLALHRNLQIIGAFSFLSEKRGKRYFRQFLRPAIVSLTDLLQDKFFQQYPALQNCMKVCGQEFVK